MIFFNRAAFLLILTVFVLMTMLYGGVHQPVLALFYVSAALLAVLWVADAWLNGLRFSRNLLQVPLLALGVYAVVQVIPFGTISDVGSVTGIPRTISVEPFATSIAAVQIFSLLLFFAAMLVFVDRAKRLRRLTGFLTIFGSAYAFFAILQSVLSPDAIFGIYKPAFSHPFGTFVNRNDYAAMMVMFMSLPLGMVFTGAIARDKRLLYLIAVGLMGTSLLLSQSRGGLITFIIEVLFLVILTTHQRGKQKLLLRLALSVLLLLAAVGGAFFVGGETSLVRFSSDAIKAEAPTETTNRFHIWSTTTRMIAENMPLGVGLGAFPAVYPRYDTASGYERVEQAHNDYLQLISDAGAVGAALGIVFLFLLIKQGKNVSGIDNLLRRAIAAGSLAGVIAVLVHSAFDFVLHITAVSLLFLMLLSILIASCRKYEDDIDDVEEGHHHRHRRVVSSRRRGSSGKVI